MAEYLFLNAFGLGLIAILVSENPISAIIRAAIALYLI